MAPHALDDIMDFPSYAPSATNYTKLQSSLGNHQYLAKNATESFAGRGVQPAKWQLDAEELFEIEQAVGSFKARNLPLSAVDSRTFPLPTLGSKLRDLSKAISGPQGYQLISGLNPAGYSAVDNVIVQTGLCCYVGSKRAMAGGEGGDKNVIHHVTPMPPVLTAAGSSQVYHGPPNQTIAIPFHNDAGEIVSLYTLSPGIRGGCFYLAPAAAIFFELQRHRPDLLAVLEQPWTMISPSPNVPSETRPLLFRSSSNTASHPVMISCSRARITGTPARPRPKDQLPPITALQHEALDAVHYIGQEVAIPINFAKGDMLFFNNLTMMHARDKFDDDTPGAVEQRHLTRLIVRDEEARSRWNVPAALKKQMSAVYDHDVEDEEFAVAKARFSWETSH